MYYKSFKRLVKIEEILELIIFPITILLFIFRSAVPFFKYPFLLFYIILICYAILSYRNKIFINFISVISNFKIVLILFSILVVSFTTSSKIYLIIFKEIFNIIGLISFFYFMHVFIISKNKLGHFINNILEFSIVFAVIISINSLYVLVIVSNSYVKIDYNFALIPIFIGLISSGLLFIELKNRWAKAVIIIMMILFTFNIMLSGSRRGILVLILIYTCMFILLFVVNIKNVKRKKDVKLLTCSYIGGVVVFVLVFILFFLYTPYSVKNNILKKLGTDNIIYTKHKITRKFYRYISFFNNELSYNNFLNELWSHEINPLDPDSGWGTRTHKTIYPLSGLNVEIVPKYAKGYYLDSTCEANTWNNKAHFVNKLFDIKCQRGKKIISSVYCYVSKDFDGTWVHFRSKGKSSGDIYDFYNLRDKGEWQKLEIIQKCSEGNIPFLIYFSKYGVKNFNSLKGYVIFAYPSYKILDANDSTVCNNSKINSQLFLYNDDYFITPKIKSVSQASLIPSPNTITVPNNRKNEDSDLIRSWVKKMISEDTTYYGYTADINFPQDPKDVIHSRTDRWRFAWELYTKEYNWYEKIIGHGFDHLNWYGYYFYNDKTKSDWPHNPFLSVLLYSGIIGLGLYIYLLYKVVSIYLKYIKEYYILFIFWGITFFFSFFSAGSPFDPPVMGFFMLLPFFIDYVHKKDKEQED